MMQSFVRRHVLFLEDALMHAHLECQETPAPSQSLSKGIEALVTRLSLFPDKVLVPAGDQSGC